MESLMNLSLTRENVKDYLKSLLRSPNWYDFVYLETRYRNLTDRQFIVESFANANREIQYYLALVYSQYAEDFLLLNPEKEILSILNYNLYHDEKIGKLPERYLQSLSPRADSLQGISSREFEQILSQNLAIAKRYYPERKIEPTRTTLDYPTLIVLDEIGYTVEITEIYRWILAGLDEKDHATANYLLTLIEPDHLFWSNLISGVDMNTYTKLWLLFNLPIRWLEFYTRLNIDVSFEKRVFDLTIQKSPLFENLLFQNGRIVEKKLNAGTQDPIDLELVGEYYFQCSNPNIKHYFNIDTFTDFCRNRGEFCTKCPVDKTFPMEPFVYQNF